MSLHPEPIGEVPVETARVARAAFPRGTVITRLRDEFTSLYEDADFRTLYPARGQPGFPTLAFGAGHGIPVSGAPQ
jgi:transposase